MGRTGLEPVTSCVSSRTHPETEDTQAPQSTEDASKHADNLKPVVMEMVTGLKVDKRFYNLLSYWTQMSETGQKLTIDLVKSVAESEGID